jgi:subtilisin family serine protease
MNYRMRFLGILLALVSVSAAPASANNRIIVRTNLGSRLLSSVCLLNGCTLVGAMDGTLNQVFLLTAPNWLNPNTLLNVLRMTPGILDAELDQVIGLVAGLNVVGAIPAALSDSSPVNYLGTTVWNGYANQPASSIVNVQAAQNQFQVSGTGIVADIDTGVDPNHPALKSALLTGYDFTRDQAGASEINDLNPSDFPVFPPTGCTSSGCPQAAIVNQSSAAILDQSSAAILDQNVKYAAFGHGTMVLGVVHLVAPNAQLLPLKAFGSDGTGYLSNILRAIYYAVQNNANVINMSFDFTSASTELANALNYASAQNVICAASAGNDGQGPPTLVYPAAQQSEVMGVASTSDLDVRSSFSNYGNSIVWVAAPGEGIVTTYPFATYSAGWGTSFSAPFVSGGAALMRSVTSSLNESTTAAAIAHAQNVGQNMGNGRLDLLQALTALP